MRLLDATRYGWTDDRIELLRQLNDSGSNAEIAERINRATGSCFSRNAVIGKRMRLGLIQKKPGRPPQTPPKHTPPKPRKRAFQFPFEPAAIIEETPMPQEFLGLSLQDIGRDQCRFPRGGYGEPILFCGQPVKKGSSYCPACHVVCYHKPTPYQRRLFISPRPGQKIRAA